LLVTSSLGARTNNVVLPFTSKLAESVAGRYVPVYSKFKDDNT
jgi:hypothetical protein